jgi:hypothetical protein
VNEIDNIKEDIKSKMLPSRQCIDDIDNMLILDLDSFDDFFNFLSILCTH